MPLVPIDTLDDPRLWPYRALKERDLRRRDGRFIAEGKLVVGRLLAARGFVTESILCNERLAGEIAPAVAPDVPIYVAASQTVDATVGFRFHNGCLAVGRTPLMPDVSQLLESIGDGPATLVIAHELNNTENLGAILRIAAGFGATAMILGGRSADPFFRQSIRVSMGTVFSLRLAQSDDLPRDLFELRARGFHVTATVAQADARPINQISPRPRQAIVLGGEAHGLDAATLHACSERATIPMHLGTDSLNVAIASAIFLYQLTRAADDAVVIAAGTGSRRAR